jgi:hypothetical protein
MKKVILQKIVLIDGFIEGQNEEVENHLFKDIKDRINLKLINTKMFNSGAAGLYYRPIKQ